MELVKKMRAFESDHEPDGWPAIQMKHVSALCDEIERLQSIIDEANAQEPVDYERLLNGEWVKCSKTRYEVTSDPVRALYARPIPAQQSVDRQAIIDILVASGNLSEGVTADLIVSAICARG